MKTTMTIFKGLTFNVEVIEVRMTDASGTILFYLADVYIRQHRSDIRTPIRRSRIPGAAADVARDIQKRGLRAFDALAA